VGALAIERTTPVGRRACRRARMTADWKQVAAGAWNSPGWKKAAAEYHRDRTGHPLIVELEPERLKRLLELLKDSTSLSRAYYEISGRRNGGAPQPTVEALMYSLRERGAKALEEPISKKEKSEQKTA
jgi:hypothetical protein